LAHRELIITLASRHRLPSIYNIDQFAASGGLISYGTDPKDLFRRAALYVDRILKGAKPGDLPIQQPTKFELIVNLKAAKAMGLIIPESFLARANEVIE
jgi:putative ABC transport system substrate-binding protein